MEKQQEQPITPSFSPADWVVHKDYGVGQIQAIEDKYIGGTESSYYRVQTDNSLIWIPLEGDGDEESLRLVGPAKEIDKAVAVLKRPSRRMSSHFKTRMARIRRSWEQGSPAALARILRDLWARRRRRGELSHTETQALRRFTRRLLAEWAASQNVEEHQLRNRLYRLLEKHALVSA